MHSFARSLALLVIAQCLCQGEGAKHEIGILADVQLGFQETDQLTAIAVMACRHIQNRDTRLVSAELSADFNVSCSILDHNFQSNTEVAEAGLHWSATGTDFMVGAYTSGNSGSLAVIAGLSEIPVVGFWAASETLSDKATYRHFGRTNPSAGVFPRAILKFMAAMGWKQFGYIYHDDANGNSFNTAFHKYARGDGLTVLTSQQYTRGDVESIQQAVKSLAASGARIFTVASAGPDTQYILEAADKAGILGRGYIWFGAIGQINSLLYQSKNRTRTIEILSGWLTIESAPFADELRWERFDSVWKSETFDNVSIADVHGVVHRSIPQTVNAQDCWSICGYMYDAIWTAALVVDRTQKEEDGKVVRGEMLETWQALQFDGATGRVEFDDKRDRGEGVPLMFINWVPVETPEGVTLQAMDIGHWETGVGLVRYAFPDAQAPVWMGLVRGWDAVPGDGSACEAGEVYSLATLQCQQCPPGTFQNGSLCAPCPRGFHSPAGGALQCLPCLRSGYTEHEGMTACTPCARNYEMREGAQASDGPQDCECRSGYIAGCSWHIWQVLVVVLAALVAAKLVEVQLRRCRQQQEEQEALPQRVRLLRKLLRLRREDGWRLAGERLSGGQWLGLVQRRPLRAKPLKHLALLTLMRRFDLEAVDSLGVLLQALAEETDAESDTASWAMEESFKHKQVSPQVAQSGRWQTLMDLIIHVSCQLLDPESVASGAAHLGPADSAIFRATSAVGNHELALVAVPDTHKAEDRFDFFRNHVAQLQLWEHGDAFVWLKGRVQLIMDSLRTEMDDLHATLLEEGGRELVEWAPTVSHQEDDSGAVQRQDHPRVNAIRVDEHARKQIAILNSGAGFRRRESKRISSVAAAGLGFGPPPSPPMISGAARGASSETAGGGSVLDTSDLERQFVDQLYLQSCLLDESFQQAVCNTLASFALEQQSRGKAVDAAAAASPAPHVVQVTAGSIKTVKRALEKVNSYAEEARSGKAALSEPYAGHVLDPIRASIICRDSQHLLETAQWVLENGRRCGLPVVRIKNKFAVKDSSEYDGYRDLMLSVLHTGAMGLRIVGELQFHDQRMHPLKVKMHRLYKVKRAATAASI